jgi:DNA invertase Pin-like site-specific DNA recombinase
MTKAIIYLRTSTKEQEPELQREKCIEFCKGIGLEVVEIVSEQGSAYKLEKIREKWESVVKMAKNEKLDIVLWRYDRAFRNREEFYKFMRVMFEVYKIKIYSVTEPSILSLWELTDKSNTGNPIYDEFINGVIKTIWNLMIQQSGEQAEEESRKKSERVKLAVRKEDGKPTKSYKGNKWGRKDISTQKKNKIKEYVNSKKTIREISEEIGIPKSVVHKYLQELKEEKS